MSSHFADGVGAESLARAPSLVFNAKDDLQARWVRRLCHRDVELPRHTVPSAHAFVTAALAGMGWGLQPEVLVAPHLAAGLTGRTGAWNGRSTCRCIGSMPAQLHR
jgi:LysR family transcriptional regulator (chromosome initiation inhibitor)